MSEGYFGSEGDMGDIDFVEGVILFCWGCILPEGGAIEFSDDAIGRSNSEDLHLSDWGILKEFAEGFFGYLVVIGVF